MPTPASIGSAVQQGADQRQRQQRPEARPHRGAAAGDRLSRRALADAEGGGDLVVAHAVELSHQEGRALVLGQRPQVLDQLGDLRARLRLGGGRAGAGDEVVGELGRRGRPVAEIVQRRVADDPVEPGAQLDLGVAAAQRLERLAEGVLGDVLVAAADDRGGEPAERAAVAPHDLLEGALVAFADEPDQPPVGLGAERRAEDEAGGQASRARGDRVGSHVGDTDATGERFSPASARRLQGGNETGRPQAPRPIRSGPDSGPTWSISS